MGSGGRTYCTLEYGGRYIVILERPLEIFLAKFSDSPKNDVRFTVEEFFSMDDVNAHPEAKKAVLKLVQKQKETEEARLEKLRDGNPNIVIIDGNVYPNPRAAFDDQLNKTIKAVESQKNRNKE